MMMVSRVTKVNARCNPSVLTIDNLLSLKSFWPNCFPVHPCDKEHGGCEQICQKKGNEALCKCRPGFLLAEDGKRCNPGKWNYRLFQFNEADR